MKMPGIVLMGLLLSSCGPVGGDIPNQVAGDYPVLVRGIPLSGTMIRIEWEDRSNGEDGFGIERRTAQENFRLRSSVGPDEVRYEDAGLKIKTTYYYRVYYFKGEEKSRVSNVIIVTTPDV